MVYIALCLIFRPEDDIYRQFLSLSIVTIPGSLIIYFIPALIAYYLYFDKRLMKHKKFKKNQIQMEIAMSVKSGPIMALMMIPFFILEVRGHTQLYDSFDDYEWYEICLQIFGFLFWNDCLVYFVHKALHIPIIYKYIHKTHHKWLIPTPFASHAFHPLDGWAQGVPYHIFILFFPMQKWVFLCSFFVLNIWTTSIHDEYFIVPNILYLQQIVNNAAHHTDHHLYFNYNLGLYFTFWDRVCGTYRKPVYKGFTPYKELFAKKS